ncbi:MAG TPA: hypothetical protein VFM27_15995, partial [Acidimicrobiales bacterium]|nr:hypothetical protein [Acidimicrobiales bacterium]
ALRPPERGPSYVVPGALPVPVGVQFVAGHDGDEESLRGVMPGPERRPEAAGGPAVPPDTVRS